MADSNTLLILERQAIQKALTSEWKEAITLNESIVAEFPDNIPAYNRLGIAFLKTNQPNKAKKYFKQVLEIDPYNTIAKTNLKKANSKYHIETTSQIVNSSHFSFIEEPGKSRVIPLSNTGEPQVIANLYSGFEVTLKPGPRKIRVVNSADQHIGYLPDDISLHLIKLIKAGYQYQTLIKSAEIGSVEVFIRELKSSKKMRGTPSFSNGHHLDEIDISSGSTSQPPLEIYDSTLEEME